MSRLLTGHRRADEPQAAPPPPRPKALRLFIAVELPDDVRRALAATVDALKRLVGEDALRWVRPEGVHLTLAFLGATPEARVPAIAAAIEEAARDVAPFPLAPLGVGSFGGRRRLRTVWVAVGGDGGRLAALAECIETALVPLGYARGDRAFNGHLTLARVRDDVRPPERARLHDLLATFEPPAGPPFTVERVSLMQSTLGPGGSAYRQLAEARLLAEAGGG